MAIFAQDFPLIAQDRTGWSLRSYWKTKLGHFTEMDLAGTTKVRVWHSGKLSESERVGLRSDINDSLWHVSAALSLVSECRRDIEQGAATPPAKIGLVTRIFGQDAPRHLGLIERRLRMIDPGLKSNIEINLHYGIPDNERKSSVLTKNYNRLPYQGVAETGSHRIDPNVRFSLDRSTNKGGRYGGRVITNLVAINSANLSNNGNTSYNIRSIGVNGIERFSEQKDRTSYSDAASYAELGYDAARWYERERERGAIRGHAMNSDLDALVRRDRIEERAAGNRPSSSVVATVGRNLDRRTRLRRGGNVR